MSKKNKNIPVPEPEKSELEYNLPSASMSDMTDIVPDGDVIPYIPRSERTQQ